VSGMVGVKATSNPLCQFILHGAGKIKNKIEVSLKKMSAGSIPGAPGNGRLPQAQSGREWSPDFFVLQVTAPAIRTHHPQRSRNAGSSHAHSWPRREVCIPAKAVKLRPAGQGLRRPGKDRILFHR
jgi:hypothetical protein